jgi:Protein of unknown function (DUF3592)
MAQRSIAHRVVRFFLILFLTSCFCCLVLSFVFALHTTSFLHTATKASGHIIRLEERFDSQNNSNEYAPVFQFVAGDRKTYTITSRTASNPAGFEIGENVLVLYKPSDPAGAELDSFWQIWLVPMILIFISAAHGFISGVFFFIERRLDSRLPQPTVIGN